MIDGSRESRRPGAGSPPFSGSDISEDLTALTRQILHRLRDPQADFQLQAHVRDQSETIWLIRRGASVSLQVLDSGGAEVDWGRSAFASADPQRIYGQVGEQITLVVIYAGGPFPDDLMQVFVPDESQPTATYRAEWQSWDAFVAWIKPAPA